jgi:DNA topoisomerase-1
MQIRTASTGVFLGCSGYGLPPKERCKSTINLVRGDDVVSADEGDDEESEAEARLLLSHRRCPKCKTSMSNYLIDEDRKLHVCGNNPDCDGYEIEYGKFVIKGYDGPLLECDKCGEEMQLKSGRFGKYFGCTSDDCKNTRKLLRSGEPAPPKVDPIPMPHLLCEKCDDFYLLRDGAAGIFLAASQFPKHRETRAPLVEEIAPLKDQLDEKYKYLADAPQRDPDGNPAKVRFLRKTKEQYVMTEIEKKATGWRAYFRDGKWVEELASKPRKAAKKKSAAKKKKAAAKTKKVATQKTSTKKRARTKSGAQSGKKAASGS